MFVGPWIVFPACDQCYLLDYIKLSLCEFLVPDSLLQRTWQIFTNKPKRGQELELTKYGHDRKGNTRQDWHYSPLPEGASHALATSNRERGGGHSGQDRRPPGQHPFWDPRQSWELGRPWRSRGPLARPHRPWLYSPPKKNYWGDPTLEGLSCSLEQGVRHEEFTQWKFNIIQQVTLITGREDNSRTNKH